jgi:FkbM family methyltransferase
MTGATGNIYCGLHEFVEMAFLLHLLRPGDLFLDVGANVGSYTVLASKVCLAKTLAFEPDADAADSLEQNIRVNGITASAVVHRVALGDHNGKIAFTKGLDTMNRIATGEDGAVQIVPVARLDDICASALPTLVKLDVEGYEEAVLAGAAQVMRSPSLLAVQSELSNSAVTDRLGSFGFTPVFYEPFTREVANRDFGYGISNMLYVRDIARIQKRVSSAPYRVVGGRQL